MKYISLSVLMLLASGYCLVAMEQEGQKKQNLAQDISPGVDEVDFNLADEACYLWMKGQEKAYGIPYQELSSDDQKVFDQLVKYKDNPEAVKRSRYNWANIVCNKVKAAGRDLPYDNNTVGETLLKMSILMHTGKIKNPKTELTIRMWANQELTAEEVTGWTKPVFETNRKKSEETVFKWANIAARKMANINLIPYTSEAIEQKTHELFKFKITDLEIAYTKKS